MSRLIDADALKAAMIETLEQIKANPKMDGREMHIIAGIAMLGEMIDDSPTIDAVPVVRGKWIPDYDYTEYDFDGCTPLPEPRKFQDGWQCSLCGQYEPSETNFCPNCGADMRQTGDENV